MFHNTIARITVKSLACAAAVALSLPSVNIIANAAPSLVDSTSNTVLQNDADTIRNAGAVGVIIAEHRAGATIFATSGVSDIKTNAPIDPDMHFRVASITKTFLATVILQLTGERDAAGKPLLSLDEPVVSILPNLFPPDSKDVAEKKTITVRQLLAHASGIDDSQGLGTVINLDAALPELRRQFATPLDPEEAISGPLRGLLKFSPGSTNPQGQPNNLYSNTNYIVLGMVIDKVTGNSWQHAITTRILDKLGLANTSIPDPTAPVTLPSPRTHGYEALPQQRSHPIDMTDLDRRTAYAAGGAIVSTAADINAFYTALLTAKLLTKDQLAQMQTTIPAADNPTGASRGLGIEKTPLSCDTGKLPAMQGYWGKTGRVFGYQTLAGVTPDAHRAITISFNGQRGVYNPDGTLNQEATDKQLQAISKAATTTIDQALCTTQ